MKNSKLKKTQQKKLEKKNLKKDEITSKDEKTVFDRFRL